MFFQRLMILGNGAALCEFRNHALNNSGRRHFRLGGHLCPKVERFPLNSVDDQSSGQPVQYAREFDCLGQAKGVT
jgi:hypothetical protein